MTQITNEELSALARHTDKIDIVKLLTCAATVFYEYAADEGALLKRAANEITQLRAQAEAAELKGWNEAIEAAHREADLEWWGGDRHRTSSTIGPVICSKIRALKKEIP